MSDPLLPPDPASDDAYALFQRGQALLADRHWAQAAVSLEKAKRLEPDKTSIREALGPGLLPQRQLPAGGRGVRGRRRAQPGQRLRALLPRTLAAEAGRPPGRPAAPEAGLRNAARTARTTGCTSTGCRPPSQRLRAGSDPARERGLGLGRGGGRSARSAQGLLILLGVGREDSEQQAARLADKVARVRVFDEDDGPHGPLAGGPRSGRGGALHQPVHSLRRHPAGAAPELHRGRRAGGRPRSCTNPSVPRSPVTEYRSSGAGSGRGCRWPCATKGPVTLLLEA